MWLKKEKKPGFTISPIDLMGAGFGCGFWEATVSNPVDWSSVVVCLLLLLACSYVARKKP